MNYPIDATNQALGRMASQIVTILRGKNKPSFQPNVLADVKVIVKNLDKVKFSGNKLDQKVYYKYSGYHGGIKTRKLSDLWATKPATVLRQVVYNMLPKNKMRDKMIKNLIVE